MSNRLRQQGLDLPLKQPRKRLLRIRVGPLANFSAGAGYMPFIVMFSVPLAFILGVICSLELHLKARRILRNSSSEAIDSPHTSLADFAWYARKQLIRSLVTGIVAGTALFVIGQGLVYGNKLTYFPYTLVLAFGPFIAWILSTILLRNLIYRRGAKLLYFAMAVVVQVVLAVLFVMVISFLYSGI